MSRGEIILITHSALADPGAVRSMLSSMDYKTTICCPMLGDQLPEFIEGHPQGYKGSIIFGGPMMVSDADSMDFLAAEMSWIETHLASTTPILGVCLGAQMIAHVLGARIWNDPNGIREIGYHTINSTIAGRYIFPQSLKVYQWHSEGFDLPFSAELLATSNSIFRNQAFRYGKKVYALQFHPEMTETTMERWITSETGAPQLQLPGAQNAAEQRKQAIANNNEMLKWLKSFLAEWLS